MIQQSVFHLVGYGNLRQNFFQRRVDQVVQRGEHPHQISLRFGNRHILGMVHQLAAKIRPHKGFFQKFLRAGVYFAFRRAGAEQIDPLLQLAQAQSHNRLADGGGSMAQGEISRVDHLQQAEGQAGVHADHLLDLFHIWFVPGHLHHQAEKVALDIGAAVGFGGQLGRHIGALHGVGSQRRRLLIKLFAVNIGNNALFVHAVGNFHRIVHIFVGNCFAVDFDIINIVHQLQIAGRKLKFIDCDLISFLRKLFDKMHRERMNNHAVVDLNHQLVFVKELRRFLHQQHGGKGHKIQRALQRLCGILHQKRINGICGGKLRAGGRVFAAERHVFPMIKDFMANNQPCRVLNWLPHNVFVVHNCLLPLGYPFLTRSSR